MLIAFLLAAAAPQAIPTVKVASKDPAAILLANGIHLQLKQECQSVSLDNLDASPTCRAAVEARAPEAVLPVAMNSIRGTDRAPEAIRLLDESVARNNHPVTHAILGLLLSSAEFVQPNYPQALRHLRIASDAGNPSAANQLAKLLYEGKGTDRDLAEAVRMSERAAALGRPEAATDLARLYHVGLLMPRNEQLSKAWLDAAVAVGEPTAIKLAQAIDSEKRVHLMQVVPSPDPAKVRVADYSPLTRPEVRADYGFDQAFEDVYKQPYSDPATLSRLELDAKQLPTPYLFELARRLAGIDKDRARKMLMVAQMRMAYDAARCMDSAAAYEAIPAWTEFVMRDARYLMLDAPPPGFFDEVLAIEADFPADNEPWWLCRAGNAARLAAGISEADLSIINTLRLKPKTEWPAKRENFRAAVQSDAGKTRLQQHSTK